MSKELIEKLREAAKQHPLDAPLELFNEAADALEAKAAPVAYITGQFAGRCIIEPISRAAVLPTGMALYSHPQPSAGVVMPDWKGLSERLMDFITHAEVSSGVCCCGDYIQGHADPMASGHSPVDMWDNAVVELGREFARLNGKEVGRG